MKLLTSKFCLLSLMAANLLVMASMYTVDPNIAYASDDQIRDERIRDDKYRDERRRDQDRDDQQRDERRRQDQRDEKRREDQRDNDRACDSDGGAARPFRNLHPELQIAAPRNQAERL